MGAQVRSRWVEEIRPLTVQPPIKISNRVAPAKTLLNRTKRQLFGAPKSEELNQFCLTELRLQQEEKRKKWNFDFMMGKPMDGPLQWEQMNVKCAPMVMLTPAAHIPPVNGSCSSVPPTVRNSSQGSSSRDELREDVVDREEVRVDVDFPVESPTSSTSTLSPAPSEHEEEEVQPIQTHPIQPSSSIPAPKRTSSSSKPSSSKRRELKQQKITDLWKERKRRPSSTAPVENISAKKVRMMMAASSSSPGVGQQQQQQEASASPAN